MLRDIVYRAILAFRVQAKESNRGRVALTIATDYGTFSTDLAFMIKSTIKDPLVIIIY